MWFVMFLVFLGGSALPSELLFTYRHAHSKGRYVGTFDFQLTYRQLSIRAILYNLVAILHWNQKQFMVVVGLCCFFCGFFYVVGGGGFVICSHYTTFNLDWCKHTVYADLS